MVRELDFEEKFDLEMKRLGQKGKVGKHNLCMKNSKQFRKKVERETHLKGILEPDHKES